MSVTDTVTIQKLINDLRRIGFSYRSLAKVLGVSHEEVRRWALGLYKPRDLNKVLRKLSELIVEDKLELVDDYYSPTHNGPPNNFFSIRPGDNHLIERFKRSIKLIADFLDIQNSKLLDYAAEIGIKYLKEHDGMKLYGVKIRSFALACFRIIFYKYHYVYSEWSNRMKFLEEVGFIDRKEYEKFFNDLAMMFLL